MASWEPGSCSNRPPVFASRCRKPVNDHVSIPFAATRRRHRLPRLYAIALSHNRTSLDGNRWQLSDTPASRFCLARDSAGVRLR